MITLRWKVHFGQGRRKELRAGAATGPAAADRVPRVSRLMALAIRLDQLIRDGEVADQAELARLGHVTRARLTQIMNLLCLAPDIQEAILFLPAAGRGRDVVTERQVRPIAAEVDWGKQRRMWVGVGRV
jgi:predicted XRE-type DNA-binding protein